MAVENRFSEPRLRTGRCFTLPAGESANLQLETLLSPAGVCFLKNDAFCYGCYELSDDGKSRHGEVGVVQILPAAENAHLGEFVIKKAASLAIPGVFRIAVESGKIFAPCTDGHLRVLTWSGETLKISLDLAISEKILTNARSLESRSLTCDSAGFVYCYDLTSKAIVRCYEAHKLKFSSADCEAWSVAWLDNNLVASGGEDSLLKLWDLRLAEASPVLNATHEAGVTECCSFWDNSLLTGSYDECLRHLDIRRIKDPVWVENLGGGVWSIVNRDSQLAIACMYRGYCVCGLTSDRKLGDTVWSSEEDKGRLWYGVDLCDRNLVACSFYDKKVRYLHGY